MKEKNKRQSNIELLRIFAMLLIIMFHYVYKSGYQFIDLTINSFLIKSFWFFGELGVNLFVLITGYFLVKGKFSVKKLICLILEVNFYYIVSNFIAIKLGIREPISGIKNIVFLFFSTIFNRYWFITAYILMYVVSPYLNKFINCMSKLEYKKCILGAIVLWSIIPTIFGIFVNSTETLLYYNRFIWLIIMYLIGAYIRLYPINFFEKRRNANLLALIIWGMMLCSILVIYKIKTIFKAENLEVAYFWPPNSICMCLLSISIFEIFLNIKIKSNIIINKLATATLGIYILHDGMLNHYLWDNIFKAKEHLEGKYSVLGAIEAALIIYLCGFIIDLIRQILEKYTIKKLLDSKVCINISIKISNFTNKIIELI